MRQCSLKGKLTPVASDAIDVPLFIPATLKEDAEKADDWVPLIDKDEPADGDNKLPDLRPWFADWFGLNNIPVEEAGSVFIFLKQASVWTWSDLAL